MMWRMIDRYGIRMAVQRKPSMSDSVGIPSYNTTYIMFALEISFKAVKAEDYIMKPA